MSFIYFIVIGALAGFIAEKILKTDMGLIMNLVLGIVGGFVGGFIFSLVGMESESDGFIWSLVTASVGAVLVLFVFNKIKSK